MTASYLNYSGGIHILQLDTDRKEVTIFQENGNPEFDRIYDIRWQFPIITLGNAFITGKEFKANYTLNYSYKDEIRTALGGPDKYLSTIPLDNFNLNLKLFGSSRNKGFLKEQTSSPTVTNESFLETEDFNPITLSKNFEKMENDDRENEISILLENLHTNYLKGNQFTNYNFFSLLDLLIYEIEKLKSVKATRKANYQDHFNDIEYTYNTEFKTRQSSEQQNIWKQLCKLRDAIENIAEEDWWTEKFD